MVRRKIIKIYLLASIVLYGSSGYTASAQTFSLLKHRGEYSTFHFGITLRYSQPWYHIIKSETFTNYDTLNIVNPLNGVGFSLGILAEWNINPFLQLRTNIAQFGIDYRTIEFYQKYPDFRESEIESKTLEMRYLQWPLILKLQSDKISNLFKVYMMAGLVWTIDVGSDGPQRIGSLHITSNDWGLIAGMGFHFYFKTVTISPEVKFSSGFSNVLSRAVSNKFNRSIQELYNRSISFSLLITP